MSISTTGFNAIKRNDKTTSSQYHVLGDGKTSEKDKVIGSGMIDTSNIRKPTSELGKDAFMQILIAQLGNQDPLEPMNDTEFIAQMAQFSALEQMQALNASFKSSQAYNYIGKTVEATTNIQDENGNWVTTKLQGVVSGIEFYNNQPYLIVGDYLLEPESVSVMYNSSSLDNSILQGGALIGKYVTASMADEEGNITEVSGKVTKVLVKNGRVYAVIDDKKEVPVAGITAINDEPIADSEDTGKPLDFYIRGDGYFVNRTEAGEEYYTRYGNFSLNENGTLVTGEGNAVLGYPVEWNASKDKDPDSIDADYKYGNYVIKWNEQNSVDDLTSITFDANIFADMYVDSNGAVKARLKNDTPEKDISDSGNNNITIPKNTEITIGYVVLANFANPSGLKELDGNNYANSKDSGDPVIGSPADEGYGMLVSGQLEVL